MANIWTIMNSGYSGFLHQ